MLAANFGGFTHPGGAAFLNITPQPLSLTHTHVHTRTHRHLHTLHHAHSPPTVLRARSWRAFRRVSDRISHGGLVSDMAGSAEADSVARGHVCLWRCLVFFYLYNGRKDVPADIAANQSQSEHSHTAFPQKNKTWDYISSYSIDAARSAVMLCVVLCGLGVV
jgi:hypothetical protein